MLNFALLFDSLFDIIKYYIIPNIIIWIGLKMFDK